MARLVFKASSPGPSPRAILSREDHLQVGMTVAKRNSPRCWSLSYLLWVLLSHPFTFPYCKDYIFLLIKPAELHNIRPRRARAHFTLFHAQKSSLRFSHLHSTRPCPPDVWLGSSTYSKTVHQSNTTIRLSPPSRGSCWPIRDQRGRGLSENGWGMKTFRLTCSFSNIMWCFLSRDASLSTRRNTKLAWANLLQLQTSHLNFKFANFLHARAQFDLRNLKLQ